MPFMCGALHRSRKRTIEAHHCALRCFELRGRGDHRQRSIELSAPAFPQNESPFHDCLIVPLAILLTRTCNSSGQHRRGEDADAVGLRSWRCGMAQKAARIYKPRSDATCTPASTKGTVICNGARMWRRVAARG